MWFYLGGMRGFIRGHAWFYSGGVRGFIWGDMHGFIWGACVVLFGRGGRGCGFIRGMHGFIRGCMVLFGGCMVLFGGMRGFRGGGVCGFFSFFGYNEIQSMSTPTGMHSCLHYKKTLFLYYDFKLISDC